MKEPLTDDGRIQLITAMSLGVMGIYKYFKPRREQRIKDLNKKKDRPAKRSETPPQRSLPLRLRKKVQGVLRREELKGRMRKSNISQYIFSRFLKNSTVLGRSTSPSLLACL